MTRGKDIVSGRKPGHAMNQVQRRRRWTFLQKLRVAQEASFPGMTVTSVAQKYGMAPSQLFRWRKLLRNAGQEIVSASENGFTDGELRELKRRVRDLERLLGRATLENEILRETVALRNARGQPGQDPKPLTDH